MKKILTLLAIPAFIAFSANAGVLVVEDFDYADGSLVGNGGWVSHSGNAGDLLVANGEAVVQHGVPSEDANLPFTGVSGMIYYGIDFTVGAITAPDWGTDFEYFAHFKDDGFGFAGRLDIIGPSGGGDFTVGIASDESTADTVWATDLTFGVKYRAIVGYNQDTNIAELWIDATSESDTSIVGEDRDDPGKSVIAFALRQSDSDNNEVIYVDGLVVGTTFADVVAAGGPKWNGYPINEGWVDTESWLGQVYVADAPWVYVENTASWMLVVDETVSESGGWFYLPM